ncbi:hypothetical protein GCM10010341_85230 [Streptomyces noursei]|nr:hypothetical protein GCM10010341_85230 [Streptomyces noursei]
MGAGDSSRLLSEGCGFSGGTVRSSGEVEVLLWRESEWKDRKRFFGQMTGRQESTLGSHVSGVSPQRATAPREPGRLVRGWMASGAAVQWCCRSGGEAYAANT